MTKRESKILRILRTVADNPRITIGTLKKIADIDISMSAIKLLVSSLVEQDLILISKLDNGFSLFVITEQGKSWIEKRLPSKREMQDSAGKCYECNKYSTELSSFKSTRLCPKCLNHDSYKESPFKNKSSIYACRENF